MTVNPCCTATREDVYRLLASCFYPPSPELIEEGCCANLAALLASVAPEAARYASDAAACSDSSLVALAVEHARLFIGPFQLVAPPYGSIYLDDAKTVMGDSTAKVAAFYHTCGLALAEDFHELPDHFAVELEFMSFLAFKQREAEIAGDTDEVSRILSLQQEFLGLFLMPWLEPFTSAVIADGEAPFYQAVARCTAVFLTSDYAALNARNNG